MIIHRRETRDHQQRVRKLPKCPAGDRRVQAATGGLGTGRQRKVNRNFMGKNHWYHLVPRFFSYIGIWWNTPRWHHGNIPNQHESTTSTHRWRRFYHRAYLKSCQPRGWSDIAMLSRQAEDAQSSSGFSEFRSGSPNRKCLGEPGDVGWRQATSRLAGWCRVIEYGWNGETLWNLDLVHVEVKMSVAGELTFLDPSLLRSHPVSPSVFPSCNWDELGSRGHGTRRPEVEVGWFMSKLSTWPMAHS